MHILIVCEEIEFHHTDGGGLGREGGGRVSFSAIGG